jgi:hypothetical protein
MKKTVSIILVFSLLLLLSASFVSAGFWANFLKFFGVTGKAYESVDAINQTNQTCTNDCSYSGQTTCSDNYAKTCGNYDADICLEWNSGTYCSNGCLNGACQTNQTNATNGQCGTSLNSCIAGTFQDINDSISFYLWNCAGINGGTTASCSLAKPVNQTGGLYVTSNPTGADLYIDNVLKRKTPMIASGLSVGKHAVKVTKAGYYDYTTTHYVYAGKTGRLSVTLISKTNRTNSTG